MGETDLELRILALEARASELELRLRALGACVDELAAALALGRKPVPPSVAHADGSLASAAVGGIDQSNLPAGLRRVVALVQAGQAAEAQRELYTLPEPELQAHQAEVALIATALFIQRGDFQSARKVLASAVEATGDARLSRVLAVVEQQAPA